MSSDTSTLQSSTAQLSQEQKLTRMVDEAARSAKAGSANSHKMVLRPRTKAVSVAAKTTVVSKKSAGRSRRSTAAAAASSKSARRPRKAAVTTKSGVNGGVAKATVPKATTVGRARTATVTNSKRTAVTAAQKSRGASVKERALYFPSASSRVSSRAAKRASTTAPAGPARKKTVPSALPTVATTTVSQQSTLTLEDLPRVALEHIYSFMCTKGDDLAQLRQTSRVFYQGVDAFLSRKDNRRTIPYRRIQLRRHSGALHVTIDAYSDNIVLHDWSTIIDKRLFTVEESRYYGQTSISAVVSDSQGRRDATITQLRTILSGHHHQVSLTEILPCDFEVIADILKDSTVECLQFLQFYRTPLDDAIGNQVIALIRATSSSRCEIMTTCAALTDPRAFLALLEDQLTVMKITETDNGNWYGSRNKNLIGIPVAVWEDTIAEKLKQGFVVRVDNDVVPAREPGRFFKKTVFLDGHPLHSVEWSRRANHH